MNNRSLFFTAQEDRRSGCPCGWVLVSTVFWGADTEFSQFSHGRRAGYAPLGLFYKGTVMVNPEYQLDWIEKCLRD
jgi:hypothetical protein